MENNNRFIENDVGIIWAQNQVILGWFVTSTGFHAKSHEILTKTLFSLIVGKQKHMDKKNMLGRLVCKTKLSWVGLQLDAICDFNGSKSYAILM